jgi:hypothetical protein
MREGYAKLENDTRLESVVRCLDARQRIDIWKLDRYSDSITMDSVKQTRLSDVKNVYNLFDNKYSDIMQDYVIDYIRFDFDSIVMIIKPNKWAEFNK